MEISQTLHIATACSVHHVTLPWAFQFFLEHSDCPMIMLFDLQKNDQLKPDPLKNSNTQTLCPKNPKLQICRESFMSIFFITNFCSLL